MASFNIPKLLLLLLISLFQLSLATRRLTELFIPPTTPMQYHNGPLLVGHIKVNLIFYGKFAPAQRAIVTDFVASLSSPPPRKEPSVGTWWKTTDKYYEKAKSKKSTLSLGSQILDEDYSLGKSLTQKQIKQLASKGDQMYAINVVLTAADVLVEGFCMSCGTHGSSKSNAPAINGKKLHKYAYIWVGNSETQCPGQCAWPYYKPVYGPQTAPLIAPNGDVGVDGMVINLAGLLAGTVTNPFGKGFYQGEEGSPMEAAAACPGVYGTGAYPGFPGNLLVDASTGASYNCYGSNGRKYLVPTMFDPMTSSCSTLL